MEHQNPTETQCLNSDIISTLPQNIIENNILSRMTLRDAVRTSILSKEWRYTWRSMPKLVFTHKMVKQPSNHCCTLLHKYKLVNAIFNVLLLHNGPTILEFESFVGNFCIDSEFAQIISYLAKGNKVKELSFNNVEVSAQMFRQFLSKCSLLEDITLIAYEKTQKGLEFAAGENKFTFVDLLQCVPLIVSLEISKYYMKYLSAGGMPRKLPTSLAHLKYLYLDLCMAEKDEISSALCMIMSSPLLKKIHFEMYDNEEPPVQQTPTDFLDPEDYPDMNLDYLEILMIDDFSNLPFEMEFVKLIMAKSPELKEARIKLRCTVSVNEELKMVKDMLLLPFPRASPYAKLIIDRP
ncbi:putative FBD domain, F-box-like domain superfamily protein [Helianthus debilis subsp. tardiflorus]